MRFTVERVVNLAENLREHVGHVHAISKPNAVSKATRRGLITADQMYVVHEGHAPTEIVSEAVA
jgi:hypothetical protein